MSDFYVCPQHTGTGGYESCCNCGGWEKNDPDYGRECTEADPDYRRYDDEESVEEVLAAYERGIKGVTARPDQTGGSPGRKGSVR